MGQVNSLNGKGMRRSPMHENNGSTIRKPARSAGVDRKQNSWHCEDEPGPNGK